LIYFPDCNSNSHQEVANKEKQEVAIQDLSKVDSCPNLKAFFGGCIILNDSSARYLMRKFPKLNKLVLNNAKYNEPHQKYTFNLSSQVINRLFSYVLKVPDHDVHFKLEAGGSIIDLVKRFMVVSTLNKKIPWYLFNTLLINQLVHIQESKPFLTIHLTLLTQLLLMKASTLLELAIIDSKLSRCGNCACWFETWNTVTSNWSANQAFVHRSRT
jgi:hypothetical protein